MSQMFDKSSLKLEGIDMSDDDSPIKCKISIGYDRIEDRSNYISQPTPASQIEFFEVWKWHKRKPTNVVESDRDYDDVDPGKSVSYKNSKIGNPCIICKSDDPQRKWKKAINFKLFQVQIVKLKMVILMCQQV